MMRGIYVGLSIILSGSAHACEAWVEPKDIAGIWKSAIDKALPGHLIDDCGLVNSMAARAVMVQCMWIDPTGQEVGYATQSLDGRWLCAWGQRPEAVVDDWALNLASGVVSPLPDRCPCPAPVRWESVCQSDASC